MEVAPIADARDIGTARVVEECIAAGRHDHMRRSPLAWQQLATPIGFMDNGRGGRLEGANCRRCGSTIWRRCRLRSERG